MMELRTYAVLRDMSYQEALEECKEANALLTEGSKILVNLEVINTYLESEINETLMYINSKENYNVYSR
jgi:hypothetical protein